MHAITNVKKWLTYTNKANNSSYDQIRLLRAHSNLCSLQSCKRFDYLIDELSKTPG